MPTLSQLEMVSQGMPRGDKKRGMIYIPLSGAKKMHMLTIFAPFIIFQLVPGIPAPHVSHLLIFVIQIPRYLLVGYTSLGL